MANKIRNYYVVIESHKELDSFINLIEMNPKLLRVDLSKTNILRLKQNLRGIRKWYSDDIFLTYRVIAKFGKDFSYTQNYSADIRHRSESINSYLYGYKCRFSEIKEFKYSIIHKYNIKIILKKLKIISDG